MYWWTSFMSTNKFITWPSREVNLEQVVGSEITGSYLMFKVLRDLVCSLTSGKLHGMKWKQFGMGGKRKCSDTEKLWKTALVINTVMWKRVSNGKWSKLKVLWINDFLRKIRSVEQNSSQILLDCARESIHFVALSLSLPSSSLKLPGLLLL